MTYTEREIGDWSKLGAKKIVGVALSRVAEIDENFVVASADVGRRFGLESLQNKKPDVCFEIGIAEQNMIGVVSGMAHEGLNPFAITYAPFITARVLDQIRVNLGMMKLGVKLIGSAAGLAAGDLTASLMAIEDIAIIRGIPGITIISPADAMEIVKAIVAVGKTSNPTYIRLTGGKQLPIVYSSDYEFVIGKAIQLRKGSDIAILATGTVVYESLQAAEILMEDNISCSIWNFHTIKPLDYDAIKCMSGYKLIVTVEEHNIIGGLGGAVAECLAENIDMPMLMRIGINDEYLKADSYSNLKQKVGLTPMGIAKRIENFLRRIDDEG